MSSFNNNTAIEQSVDFHLATVFEVGSKDLIFKKAEFYFCAEDSFNPNTDFKIGNEYDLSIKSMNMSIEDIIPVHAPDPYFIGNDIIAKLASNDMVMPVLH